MSEEAIKAIEEIANRTAMPQDVATTTIIATIICAILIIGILTVWLFYCLNSMKKEDEQKENLYKEKLTALQREQDLIELRINNEFMKNEKETQQNNPGNV